MHFIRMLKAKKERKSKKVKETKKRRKEEKRKRKEEMQTVLGLRSYTIRLICRYYGT